jgi:hypothetical protein
MSLSRSRAAIEEHTMSNRKLKSAYILSAIIAVLALVASLGGLLIEDLYQGNALLVAGWYGNDLVTAVVAIPLLVGSLILSMRGSCRARLIWMGMLAYTLYNFAYYLFGAAFNSFFLIYVVLFDLSIIALILAFVGSDMEQIGQRFRSRTPARWIAGFMGFVAVGLSAVYGAQSLNFIFTGELPEIVTLTGHLTNIVFALDLSLVVPWFVLGAIWLWQRRPWGYVLSTIVNVKSAVYMLALSAVTLSAVRAGASDDLGQVGLWGSIGVGSLIASAVLLRNARPD